MFPLTFGNKVAPIISHCHEIALFWNKLSAIIKSADNKIQNIGE